MLVAMGAAGVTALTGCGGGSTSRSPSPSSPATVLMYRRSTSGQRASNAAKAHAANKRYPTAAAAAADPAHPGDKAYVVEVHTSRERFDQYFGGGATSVDLRQF